MGAHVVQQPQVIGLAPSSLLSFLSDQTVWSYSSSHGSPTVSVSSYAGSDRSQATLTQSSQHSHKAGAKFIMLSFCLLSCAGSGLAGVLSVSNSTLFFSYRQPRIMAKG